MIFVHTPTIREESIYTKSVETLKQTKNSLQFWLSEYAFFKTYDDKLYPVRYLQENVAFLKYGSITPMSDLKSVTSVAPPEMIKAIEYMQNINNRLLKEFAVASCSVRKSVDNEFEYFDFTVYIIKLNIYIKIYDEQDLQLLCKKSVQSLEELKLSVNTANCPYNTLIANDGNVILREGKKFV